MLNCVWQILKCEFCRRSYVAVMLKMKVEHSESMKVLFSLSIAILGLLYCRLLSVHFSTIDLPGNIGGGCFIGMERTRRFVE
ncbi:hypothetical protein SCA6_001480 [Theobroma cacao]